MNLVRIGHLDTRSSGNEGAVCDLKAAKVTLLHRDRILDQDAVQYQFTGTLAVSTGSA